MSVMHDGTPQQRPVRQTARDLRTYFDRSLRCHAAKVMPGEYLVTSDEIALCTLLGSCVSACIRDPLRRIGGMNHFLLPGDPDEPLAAAGDCAPGRYGVFAMELLINALLKRGARRESLEAKVFGGGQVMRSVSTAGVGARWRLSPHASVGALFEMPLTRAGNDITLNRLTFDIIFTY